jgi:hypothetical protein
MQSIEDLTVAVEAAEAAAEQVAALGYLQARIAGIKSRYKSFDVPVPEDVMALDAEVQASITATKADMVAKAEVSTVSIKQA